MYIHRHLESILEKASKMFDTVNSFAQISSDILAEV